MGVTCVSETAPVFRKAGVWLVLKDNQDGKKQGLDKLSQVANVDIMLYRSLLRTQSGGEAHDLHGGGVIPASSSKGYPHLCLANLSEKRRGPSELIYHQHRLQTTQITVIHFEKERE